MNKTMNHNVKINEDRQAGFTLVEIIAVLLILGILAVAALPKFTNAQEKARESVLASAVSELNAQVTMAFLNNRLLNGPMGQYDGFTGGLGPEIEIGGQVLNTPAEGTIKLSGQTGTYTLSWQEGSDTSPGFFSLGAEIL